jgi:hypothetical protein
MIRNSKLIFAVVGLLAVAGCNAQPSMDTSKLPQAVNVTVEPTDGHPGQIAAADALGRIGQPAVIMLSQSLSDPDPIVRLQSCRALAYMGAQAKDAVQPLTLALNDPEEAVREGAAAALGQIGAAAAPAVPALMQMMRGKSVVGGQ